MKIEEKRIGAFIIESNWLSACDAVSFLASGEYNENYIVRSGPDSYVFRINRGSQLGIPNQIEYEYNALQAVFPSGATPQVFNYHPGPDGFPGGVLMMAFIEGRPFVYAPDLEKAAAVFAAVHSLPIPDTLIVQNRPIAAIADESRGLLSRYPDHPLRSQHAALLNYHDEIHQLAGLYEQEFENDRLSVVNTEVNSGNFIVQGPKAYLVDWEKAVISSRYQDLGHFLVPTTTLWKSDFACTPEDRRRFLSAYRKCCPETPDLDELSEKTAVLEKTILLRAMAWCYMAYFEYTRTDRALKNSSTFKKIQYYMDELSWFLR